jgi:hypothetical protein
MAATPWLAIITVDPQKYPPKKISLNRELDSTEYADYKQAHATLSRFLEDQQRMRLLRDSYEEYKSAVLAYAKR